TQAQEYREEIAMLNCTMTGDTSKVNETIALLKYVENAEMLTAFDDELFGKFVNRIMVFNRNQIGFELRCGLKLRERLD
ncbi:MAG: recombinase family protein, partial [Clostridia bacterium]|nr:recombinase family protein [Clostridia bacterium]